MSASLLRNLNANEVIMRIENEDSDDMLETQSVSDSDPDFVFIQEFDEDEENWQGVKSKKLSNYAQRSSTVTLGKRKRVKRARPFGWKNNICKRNRLAGLNYKSRKGKQNIARQCASLTEDDRQWVFKNFRKMESWSERRSYVRASVSKVTTKQRKIAENMSRRKSSFEYHLQLQNGKCILVCKKLFSATIGISQRTLLSWLEGPAPFIKFLDPHRPRKGKTAFIQRQDMDFIIKWLHELPTLSSHYCRSRGTYKNKKYLYPGTTVSNLHRLYSEEATNSERRVISIAKFRDIFNKENFSSFRPRKPQCDICVGFSHGNIDDGEYRAHVISKDVTRAEKNADKESADVSRSVWTMDLQAVLILPKTHASSMYYKTKLQMHNFTLYNLQTKEGFCYPREEHEGDLSSEVFASLQFSHFNQYVTDHPSIKELVIWSDGCGYQNRNVIVANAYLDLARKHKIKSCKT
ncbi:uncharacterized protein LOC144424624 [Styela clava]